MTDAKNPFADMMAMGQQWARALNPELENFSLKGMEAMWPTMPKEMMEAFMGKGVSPDGLDARTRLLLTLLGLTVQGAQADSQVRLTVRHALEAGATRQEVAETIALAAMFGGVPAMTRAMDLAREVMDSETETEATT